MIRTILVPVDGSALSERALPLAAELARALEERLVLVCVAGTAALDHAFTEEDRRDIADQYTAVREEDHRLSTDPRMVEHARGQVRAVAEAERYLANVASRLEAEHGLHAEVAIPYGGAADGILTEIDLHAADLVVMCTHGRTGLSRLVSASVTQAVLARSAAPVLLVPPERP